MVSTLNANYAFQYRHEDGKKELIDTAFTDRGFMT